MLKGLFTIISGVTLIFAQTKYQKTVAPTWAPTPCGLFDSSEDCDNSVSSENNMQELKNSNSRKLFSIGESMALPETENTIELIQMEGGMEIKNDFNDTIIYPSSVYCGSYGWYDYYCKDDYKCVDQGSYYTCVHEDASKVGLIIGIVLSIVVIAGIILCSCCCQCCCCYAQCRRGSNTNVVVQQQQQQQQPQLVVQQPQPVYQQQQPQPIYQQQPQPVYQQTNKEGPIQIV